MGLKNNYYFSSFFWSTFQKILNAIVGFISVPLLLGYYGKAEYGILGIATACNGYMHLLDLGMNVGAVKFFSQWKTEGKRSLIDRVARTNITFYGIISVINIIGLVALAIWGERLFAVTHEQFLQLRMCLLIIALFSVFSWGATTFNQLLVAHMQIAYTMKVQCMMSILKALLIGIVFLFSLSLTQYFFFLTGAVALLIIPYAIKCHKLGILSSYRPATYWNDFKIVLTFSLSIFALSLFQTTATQSRPILLSIFANDGAGVVAEFRIVEVVPQLIIMMGGVFSGIFLPKTSSMVAEGNPKVITDFAYKWTKYTAIIINLLTIPFILCAKEILSAYVGGEYKYLSTWLVIWCLTVLVQMHTTPGNALVLAYGRTRSLIITTAISCILSILLNIVLIPRFGVGAAIISYFLYVIVVIGLYYLGYYKTLLKLSRLKMLMSFLKPTILSLLVMLLANVLPINWESIDFGQERISYMVICGIKTVLWIVPYTLLLYLFKIVTIKELKQK